MSPVYLDSDAETAFNKMLTSSNISLTRNDYFMMYVCIVKLFNVPIGKG